MDNNEVVKQENKKHGKDIVIIVLVFVIALLLGIIIGQFALNNNSKNSAENNKTNEVTKKDNNTTDTEKTDNSANTSNTEKADNSANTGTSTTKDNTSVTKKTDEEIAKELFTQHIIEVSTTDVDYKLQEYKIDSVNILRGNDRASAVDIHKGADGEGDSFPDTDIFAEIIYSIKPVDINNSGWLAGNGAISNGWIEQKHNMVHIVKENGTYKINDMGTSW